MAEPTLEENVADILANTNTIITQLNTISGLSNDIKNNTTSINALSAEIRGETPDIRSAVTDVVIERIYIGDVEEKRQKAEARIASLLAEGYRPYINMGVSEDLARIAFAKYTGPNSPVLPN